MHKINRRTLHWDKCTELPIRPLGTRGGILGRAERGRQKQKPSITGLPLKQESQQLVQTLPGLMAVILETLLPEEAVLRVLGLFLKISLPSFMKSHS